VKVRYSQCLQAPPSFRSAIILVVETRNCCVCASASPSVSQSISRFLSEVPCAVQVHCLAAGQHKTENRMCCSFWHFICASCEFEAFAKFFEAITIWKAKSKVCTWYQQVVHVRAQLQRSDGVSTVAYCLLNAEHGSLHSECFVHAHAVIFPTHEAACVYLLFQVCTHASNKHMSHMFPIYSNLLPPLLCTCSTKSAVFGVHRTALNWF
jgi:hypothetical protein